MQRFDIRVADPEGMVKPIPRDSPEETKIKALEQQVRDLQSRIPRLEFEFVSGANITNTITCEFTTPTITEVSRKEIADHVGEMDQKRRQLELFMARGQAWTAKDYCDFQKNTKRTLPSWKHASKWRSHFDLDRAAR